MLYLNVPYQEKEAAKAAGARWDPQAKKWYVGDRRGYRRCLKWIDGGQVVCDQLYIVEGKKKCFRCGKETRVIGFGFDNYYEIDGDHMEYWSGEIHIGNILSPIPEKLAAQLRERYAYYWGYSNTTKHHDNSNHCQACGVLQGNWFVFDEVDSPFFIDGPEAAKDLTLHRIPLKEDIVLTADIGLGSEDDCIKDYARIVDSDLRWE